MNYIYKYRSGDSLTLERDLDAIERNYFWGSSIEQLNDPTETLLLSNNFKKLTNSFTSIFGNQIKKALDNLHNALDDVISSRREIGIYSLSRTYKDELLWAHYSNSHKGFCIEYDLETLLQTNKTDKVYAFPIKYSNHPPEIEYTDVSDKEKVAIVKKLAGHKSMRWAYEKEYRIITEKSGKHPYNYEAVKGIYFGLRFDESQKVMIMNRLKGRGIKYYQMYQIEDSYQFERNPLADINGDNLTYLKQLPQSSERLEKVKFKILEKDFNKFSSKGEITIELNSKIDKKDLLEIAELIKQNLFCHAENIFIAYYISTQLDEIAWATTNYSSGKFDVSINDSVLLR